MNYTRVSANRSICYIRILPRKTDPVKLFYT